MHLPIYNYKKITLPIIDDNIILLLTVSYKV